MGTHHLRFAVCGSACKSKLHTSNEVPTVDTLGATCALCGLHPTRLLLLAMAVGPLAVVVESLVVVYSGLHDLGCSNGAELYEARCVHQPWKGVGAATQHC